MRQFFNPYNLPVAFPPQHQPWQPGIEGIMVPRPISEPPYIEKSGEKLLNKVAVITGGDSGIGRAVAYTFAKEGADIGIVYYNEHVDADETKSRINQLGRRCIAIAADIRSEENCQSVVQQVMRSFGKLDILVNNAAVIFQSNQLENISRYQLELTFAVNVFACFYLTKAALTYMKPGGSIINTASIAAFRPYGIAIDYEATKGAIVAFTGSLSRSLISRGIRVNCVAPGETWTPIVPAGFSPEVVASYGTGTLLGRAAQPFEMAPSYVFLASEDSSYMTGQTIHVYA
ncbi:MAG: NAD(P)-dependent oxidoreductase [Clostridiales bacterium GWB2_37_7]|nr:MAG: NAD(P)-dependent oxidoreductase [Clostridiales bacterium GWB2_37_7]